MSATSFPVSIIGSERGARLLERILADNVPPGVTVQEARWIRTEGGAQAAVLRYAVALPAGMTSVCPRCEITPVADVLVRECHRCEATRVVAAMDLPPADERRAQERERRQLRITSAPPAVKARRERARLQREARKIRKARVLAALERAERERKATNVARREANRRAQGELL